MSDMHRVESDGLAAAAAIAAASFCAVIDTHLNSFLFSRRFRVRARFGAADGSTA
jgi:hypothetical protein